MDNRIVSVDIVDGELIVTYQDGSTESLGPVAELDPEELSAAVLKNAGDIVDLKRAVSALQTSVTALDTAVGAAETSIDSLEAEVSAIKNDLSEKADKSEALSAYIVETETGAIASFTDGADDVPVKDLVVNIEPVQSGSGDPSPSNVRQISGHTQAVVTRTGNNLFDKSNTANILNNADFSGTTIGMGSQRCVVFIPCKPNRTYMASRKAVLTNERFAIGYTTELPAVGVAVANVTLAPNSQTVGNLMSLSITTDSDAKYVVVWAYWDNMTDALDDLQIELGSTATAYEPYQGETYEVDWTTEAGTVYGGTLDVTTGVLTVDRAYLTNAQLIASEWTGAGNGIYVAPTSYELPNNSYTSYVNPKLLATALPTKDQNTLYSDFGTVGIAQWWGNRFAFSFGDATISSVEVFKAKIAENGSDVVYPLATPQTYQLTPEEVKTVLGQNNIFADCGSVNVQYRADTKLYIDKVLNA